MRVGVTVYIQGYQDWNRYEAAEHGEAPPIDPQFDRRRYDEEIEQALMIEDLGYDSIWGVEHHIAPYTMTPNPVQLLAFLAGATKRIDVGTMVVVLPWHHPVRVAEDITMLQYALRGRRAFIGFGRGAGRREFQQLGFNMNESQERFGEAIQIVQAALKNEKFSFHGKHYNFDDVTMRPRPRDVEQLLHDMHFSWGSPTSAPIGAKYGLKPLIIPQRPFEEYHAELAAFNAAAVEAGHEAARPRIHLNMYCHEDPKIAAENAARYIAEYTDSASRNYELRGGHFANTKGYEHYAAMASQVTPELMAQSYLANHIWGTPEQCIEKLQRLTDAFDPEEYMMVMRFGSMPHDVSVKSMELFAKEVLPVVRARAAAKAGKVLAPAQ
jgi:alkanesulfonate monooxygenase SsuD/methylene tetrahydromethanopterin reductase-like flavin-dependent oxidoreductase (luciferase family)